MKELSVVEMNAVSGAGWGPWAGAGAGFVSGILALSLIAKVTNQMPEDRTHSQYQNDLGTLAASTVLGAISGAIAEAR